MQKRSTARRDAPACVYCEDALEAAAFACRCGAVSHPWCRMECAPCPTVGCPERVSFWVARRRSLAALVALLPLRERRRLLQGWLALVVALAAVAAVSDATYLVLLALAAILGAVALRGRRRELEALGREAARLVRETPARREGSACVWGELRPLVVVSDDDRVLVL